MTALEHAYQIIQKPVITEKATDDGLNRNAYHFRVPLNANKVEIRQAIELLFKDKGIKVQRVNTLRVPSKYRRRGYVAGSTQAWKKAMVTLAEGQTIELF